MNSIYKILIIALLQFLFSINSNVNAQLLLQDDFQVKNEYWYWRADGNQNQPTVKNGLLHLKLENAINTEYCNTEIYDPTEPYTAGTQARIRLKASNIHHGSRGWGFWDGDIDIPSVALDFDVAWIMQQGSHIADTNYRWFLFGVDSDSITNKQIFDLDNLIDETQWHTYKIIWNEEKVDFFVNDILLYQTSNYIPNQAMRMDIWIDNRVLNRSNPINRWHNAVDISEMMVDFVEISTTEGPRIKRKLRNDIILWESPNSFPNGLKESLWKEYQFTASSDGEALLFLTGNAESYSSTDDDDLKIIFDGTDYGWDSKKSFNGDEINGAGKSISMPIKLSDSNHKLQLVSDVTPFLRDVIVLFNKFGKVILNEEINESPSEQEGLWKSIDFKLHNSSNLTFLISGKLNANDSLMIEIDNKDFGWNNYDMIEDNSLSNLPSTVIIEEFLEEGSHELKLHTKGNPIVYSIAAYGSSIITNINQNSDSKHIYSLNNYPNPFNAETKISYNTAIASFNKVTIINAIGEEIATLVNKFQPAGNYNLVWNASNQTSGLYFCLFNSDNHFEVKKLLLLK